MVELEYIVGETIDHPEANVKSDVLKCIQTMALGNPWRNIPHVRGEGRYVAVYLSKGTWMWDDDRSWYKLTSRYGLNVTSANAIDAMLQDELFPSLEHRIRTELVVGMPYVIDCAFAVQLSRDNVVDFDAIGHAAVMELHDE